MNDRIGGPLSDQNPGKQTKPSLPPDAKAEAGGNPAPGKRTQVEQLHRAATARTSISQSACASVGGTVVVMVGLRTIDTGRQSR